jgi:hypothetical protein
MTSVAAGRFLWRPVFQFNTDSVDVFKQSFGSSAELAIEKTPLAITQSTARTLWLQFGLFAIMFVLFASFTLGNVRQSLRLIQLHQNDQQIETSKFR